MTGPLYKSNGAAQRIAELYRQVLDAWPVPHEVRRLQTRFGETFVLSCGPPDGPPVVLLHGSQANSAAWLPDIKQWAGQLRLHAIDMIGEPGFSAPVQPDLATDAHAQWLDDVFTAIGLKRAALVGTSLGGWLALDYATRRPGFATALALFCPAGIGRQRNFLLRALPLLLLGPWGAERMRGMIFGPRPDPMPEALIQIGPLMDHIGAAIRPRVLRIPRLTDAQLRGLSIPILVIVGRHDALLNSAETRDRLHAQVPVAEVVYDPDGYHFLPGHGGRVLHFLQAAARA